MSIVADIEPVPGEVMVVELPAETTQWLTQGVRVEGSHAPSFVSATLSVHAQWVAPVAVDVVDGDEGRFDMQLPVVPGATHHVTVSGLLGEDCHAESYQFRASSPTFEPEVLFDPTALAFEVEVADGHWHFEGGALGDAVQLYQGWEVPDGSYVWWFIEQPATSEVRAPVLPEMPPHLVEHFSQFEAPHYDLRARVDVLESEGYAEHLSRLLIDAPRHVLSRSRPACDR